MKKKQLPALLLTVSVLFVPALAGAASLMLGPADFTPTTDNLDFTKGDTELRNNSHLVGEDAYLAAVHLPDGARINRAIIKYYDDGEEDMRILLRRAHYDSGSLTDLFTLLTSGAVAAFRTEIFRAADLHYRVINNSKYKYYVVVGFRAAGSAYRFRALRIDYTVP